MYIDKKTTIEYDKKYIWHPFTQMKDWVNGEPMVITEGDGNYIIDADGKRYLDGASSIWCNVHGHRKKELDEALKEQLGKIAHSTFLGLTHPNAALLSKMLADITPDGINKFFYSDSGSEAVEIALKMAYLYWQHKGEKTRNKFIAFKESYHGDSIGAVSVGGMSLFHATFRPLLFETYFAPSPYCRECQFRHNENECSHDNLSILEEELSENPNSYAAVIIEPLIQGAGGLLAYPKGILKRVREITKKYNTLLIVDEVATGFGRTTKMFASEHEGVIPDIMCMAKGITGGYLPLAATATTDEIYNAYYDDFSTLKTFFHGHTYTANPLACAVGVESLNIFEREKVLEESVKKAAYLKEKLYPLMELPHVGDVRLRGLMGGVELIADKESDKQYDFTEKMGYKVCDGAIRRGVWLRPLGNVVVIMPPLSVTFEEIDNLANALKESVTENT